jgi:hypothetical protein
MSGLAGRPADSICRHYDGRVAESQEIGTMPGPDERGGESEAPQVRTTDGGYGTDPPRAYDRPGKGSLDDLRRRQDGLPHGHPSSRFNDDGSLKPPLVPLKNLELPDDERETSGAGRDQARLDRWQASDSRANGTREQESSALAAHFRQPEPRQAEARQPEPRQAEARHPEARQPEARQPETWRTQASQPEAWQPEVSQREAWQPEVSQPNDAQPEAWEQQDHSEQQDARDEPATEGRWAVLERGSAALAPEPAEDRPITANEELARDSDAISGYGYDSEAERDSDPDADRNADTDPGPPAQDQEVIADEPTPSSADQPQARSAEDLTPEQVRIAVRALGRCRLAEGRSVFGSYGEGGLTPAMRRIEDQLEHGKLAPDTEKYALKSLDRFQEKLAKLIADEPDKSAEEHAEEIHDGVRYTFLFDRVTYVDDLTAATAMLEAEGYTMTVRKNTWGNDEYKGINTRWVDPESNLLFEIQFHTYESWSAKQRSHDAYEKVNKLEIMPTERERLRDYQREISAKVPLPSGWQGITDYRREG